MSNTRTKVYIKAIPQKGEFVYSGIEFAEFIQYVPQPIENLMIITGGSNVILCETDFDRGFELFEGDDLIEKLTKENVYGLGDFCFVDYSSPHKTDKLSEEQIAELLYMGHMFKPLRSPFFEELCNNFVYLAHDDGWYCKLYSRNLTDIITVLCKKIVASNNNICDPAESIKERILQLTVDGLLIDLDELSHKDGCIEAKFYTVGEYSDMDSIQNNLQHIKSGASKVSYLSCGKTEWNIS